MPDLRELLEKAMRLADEITQAEKELLDSGWGGYPWEHLGDASKDIHILIAGLIAASALVLEAEEALREIARNDRDRWHDPREIARAFLARYEQIREQ